MTLDPLDHGGLPRHLAVDAALCDRLVAEGCAGPEWDSFVAGLYRKATKVAYRWLVEGRIFAEAAKIGRPVAPGDVADWATDDLRALAHEVVQDAFTLFRTQLLDGRYDASCGATLFTYFMNAVSRQFPNVFRRASTARRSWEHRVTFHGDPLEYDQPDHEDYHAAHARYATLLFGLIKCINAPQQRQAAWLSFAEGQSNEQIAQQLEISSDAGPRTREQGKNRHADHLPSATSPGRRKATTDHSNDMDKPENLSFEEFMAQSSVGGDTDPALDDVCTDEEADAFAADYSRRQAAGDAVLHAASEVVSQASDRNRTKQLVSAGAAGPTVEQVLVTYQRDIDAVEFTRPPVVESTDTTVRNELHPHTSPCPPVMSSNATEMFARLRSQAFHELVRGSMAGDQEATATLFVWIRPAIVRYCRSRIGRSGSTYSSADDVAQEICMAVLGALARYGDEPESFFPFVYGIAAHKVADHYRRAGRDRPDPAGDVPDGIDLGASPEQMIMTADLRDWLTQLLNTLPPRQREILVLRLVVGLSAQETATAVGLTPTAVRVTQNRAIAKLRTVLSPAEWV